VSDHKPDHIDPDAEQDEFGELMRHLSGVFGTPETTILPSGQAMHVWQPSQARPDLFSHPAGTTSEE
jgi:hypothetical protein